MNQPTLKRSFFQRLLGRPATPEPADPGCWEYNDGRVLIDLDRAGELAKAGGSIRLEGRNLPQRILVIKDDNGRFGAYHNCCGHGGRRLDLLPGSGAIQCCSLGKTTHDLDGKVLSGPSEKDMVRFSVSVENNRLTVNLS